MFWVGYTLCGMHLFLLCTLRLQSSIQLYLFAELRFEAFNL